MKRLILVLAALLPLTLPAAAQDYPSRPVKLVAPFPAAGPLDVLARLLAQRLGEIWKHPVVVENITGATGSIGANAVARAAPDGHTLLMTVDIPLTMYPAVAKSLPYDPERDFKPIASIARTDNGLFVNAGLGVGTVAELVALAKQQPSKLTFSSAGIASPAHFGGELFKVIAGVDMTHVPYKGAAPAMTAALSGEVSLMFGPIAQGAPHVKSGKLRALGVTGPNPSPLLPGVKPLVEQGFPGLLVFNSYPLMAPAATPDAVTQKIHAAVKQAMSDPAVRQRLESAAIEPIWQEPAQVAATLAADRKRWAELAKRAGIQSPN
ncbi:MAG: Bug family tripartite tricarboxylate transporter substrate binding protein [Betaproteobacteria bacterium]